ncbi:MAG: carboxylating nicotinate-nucleotide diphosphorylase [Acidimicrobiia bacterium]|nr:carboxylating nicotinate-nucleotide diphosphorylase [Acidimicrobiia bacterium]
MKDLSGPPRHQVERLLREALREDLATAGDLTTNAIFAKEDVSAGRIVARQEGRIAGINSALAVFSMLPGEVRTIVEIPDGRDAVAGAVIAEVEGSTRAILTGERTCLNLLGHMCGIATATRDAVALTEGTSARIVDTRKTTPGLRAFEKYAVRCGGGSNHRFGLHDAVMIKDNHIAAAGSIKEAVAAARAHTGHMVKVEVEVDRLDQIDEVLAAGADVILLDNMTPAELSDAVVKVGGRAITEASGGITRETIAAVAASGVDVISMGALTHSSIRLDVALDM